MPRSRQLSILSDHPPGDKSALQAPASQAASMLGAAAETATRVEIPPQDTRRGCAPFMSWWWSLVLASQADAARTLRITGRSGWRRATTWKPCSAKTDATPRNRLRVWPGTAVSTG